MLVDSGMLSYFSASSGQCKELYLCRIEFTLFAAFKPCSHRTSALTLLDRSGTYLTFVTAVEADEA